MNVLELCVGAGGMALGLERAGFTQLFSVDSNRDCISTLRQNRPDWDVLFSEIELLNFEQWRGRVDLLAAGFPCQPFSYAGEAKGLEDSRGTVFYAIAKAISQCQPRAVLLENVKGLRSHDNGKTLSVITSTLQSLGYSLFEPQVLNAVNFGVPQKRERLFILAVLPELVTQSAFAWPVGSDRVVTVREALAGVPPSQGAVYSERKRKVMDMVPEGGCWVDLPDQVARDYMGKGYFASGGRRNTARRLSWDKPSLTLTCSPAQTQTERCHPSETRPLTVREYARIQSFPDDWEFTGSLSSQYRQIGNAVPVLLAEAVGRAVAKIF